MLLAAVFLALTVFTIAQNTGSDSGYVGYNLTIEGDKNAVVFSSDETNPNFKNTSPPDVYLNATVHVGELDIQVDNLTAKVNLNAQVLHLLTFNAGIDISIDSVSLLIEKVDAKVLLEARLEMISNLVLMIDDVLNSTDLNPVIATLASDLSQLASTATSALNSSSSLAKRSSLELEHNILYSTNNYLGDTHSNFVLTQDGDIIRQMLNNDGKSLGSPAVGSYKKLMTFTGYDEVVQYHGQAVHEQQWSYEPLHGIFALSAIYVNDAGAVLGTQVIAESFAGGMEEL